MNIEYERLTAAIMMGIADGLRLARQEAQQEKQDRKVQKVVDNNKFNENISHMKNCKCDICNPTSPLKTKRIDDDT